MEPSRELAEQTYNEIKNFKKYLDAPVIRTMLVVSDIPNKEQLSDLQKGVDMLLAHRAILDELIKSENTFNPLRFFVLDEADGLLPNYQVGSATFTESTNIELPNWFCRIDMDSFKFRTY